MPIVTTAATASVSGKVMTGAGKGIAKARVTITDGSGNTRSAATNRFGNFYFYDIPTGQTYILTVQARRYQFGEPTRVLSITEDLTDVNFTALP